MNTLRLGTRKSALAQAQTNWVAAQIRSSFPDTKIEMVLITTSGDALTEGREAKGEGGLKALFTKEIEEALLDHRIDLAVHSLKDMAADLPKGLVIGAVPERKDPRDAWISKNNVAFKQLKNGANVGTGSVRRQAQLHHLRSDLNIIPMRGNVDTRLRKLEDGEVDGLVLAQAGLTRLGREKAATGTFAIDELVPAVGQGCLGIQIRDGDSAVAPLAKALDHSASHAAAVAERAFLRALGGTCQTPIAGHASVEAGQITMIGLVISPDGLKPIRGKESGRQFDAAGVGERLARMLLAAGADKILHL